MSPVRKSPLERAFESAAGADPGDGPEAADGMRDKILAAAHEQFRLVGVRRSSVEDVARRAGISRISVYRRFATKDALVEEVLLHALRGYFTEFRAAVRHAPTATERVVEGFVISLQAARRDPLAGGMMVTEPHVLVPFLTTEGGRILASVREFVAGQLGREQLAGNIAGSVDVQLVAELLVRVTFSFFVTPQSYVDLDDAEQLRNVARQLLAPLVAG
jgi:TetR/AcrR family transcriptional repressor of uid operon